MSDLIQLTGLWLNEKNGEKYFSGNLGGAKVLIFKNKHKEKENQPDYILYVAPKNKEQQQGPRQQQFQGPPDPAARQQGDPSGYPNKAGFQDDIPGQGPPVQKIDDNQIPF